MVSFSALHEERLLMCFQVIAVPSSLEEFLRAAGDKLGVIARKAFTENGALLDDVGLIRDDEKVFISSGEPFWKADSKQNPARV
jgi:BTB/POZ domain-containing protein KCTD9